MRPNDVTKTLVSLWPTKRPLLISGPPGTGKSALFRQAADELGVEFLDVRGLLHDPSDLKFPMPDLKKGEVRWVNSLFPRDPEWEGIVLLEELDKCVPLMQGAFLQVCWDRAVGDYKLPEKAWVCAAANRQEDRAGAHRLITPLLNRFIHIDLDVSVEDWQAWAVREGVSPDVRAFINWRPSLLHNFKPELNERAFASPRSWHMLSEVLPVAPEHLLPQLAMGTVGEGPAAEFVAFRKVYQSLPDVGRCLADPTRAPVPREPDVLFALSGALVERCREADLATLGACVRYHGRMPQEFSVLTMRDLALLRKEALALPESTAWLRANHQVFLETAQ